MKQINQFIKTQGEVIAPLSAEYSTRTLKPQLPMLWVDSIFKKMHGIYLNKWTSQFHTEQDVDIARGEWAEGLAGMSGDQIKKALDKCRKEFVWAPSIAEFRSAGMGGSSLPEQNRAAYKAFSRLPSPMVDPEVKRAAMSIIKEMIGNKKPDDRANDYQAGQFKKG